MDSLKEILGIADDLVKINTLFNFLDFSLENEKHYEYYDFVLQLVMENKINEFDTKGSIISKIKSLHRNQFNIREQGWEDYFDSTLTDEKNTNSVMETISSREKESEVVETKKFSISLDCEENEEGNKKLKEEIPNGLTVYESAALYWLIREENHDVEMVDVDEKILDLFSVKGKLTLYNAAKNKLKAR